MADPLTLAIAGVCVASAGALGGLSSLGFTVANYVQNQVKHCRFSSTLDSSLQVGCFGPGTPHVVLGPVLPPNGSLTMRFNKKLGTAFCLFHYNPNTKERGTLLSVFLIKDKADVKVVVGRRVPSEPISVVMDNLALGPLPRGRTDEEILCQRALEYFFREDFKPYPATFVISLGAGSRCLSHSSRSECVERVWRESANTQWHVLVAAKEQSDASDTHIFPFHHNSLPLVFFQNVETKCFLKVGVDKNDTKLQAAPYASGDTSFQWSLEALGNDKYVLRNNGTKRMFSCAGVGLPMRVNRPHNTRPGSWETVHIKACKPC